MSKKNNRPQVQTTPPNAPTGETDRESRPPAAPPEPIAPVEVRPRYTNGRFSVELQHDVDDGPKCQCVDELANGKSITATLRFYQQVYPYIAFKIHDKDTGYIEL